MNIHYKSLSTPVIQYISYRLGLRLIIIISCVPILCYSINLAYSSGETDNGNLSSTNSAKNFSSYEDGSEGIKIMYPANSEIYHNHDTNSTLTSFGLPEATLQLTSRQIPNATLDDYTTMKIKEITQRWNISEQMLFPGQFKILNSSEVTLGNQIQAHKLVYECGCFPDLSTIKRMEVWALHNNKLYDIFFQGSPSGYEGSLAAAEKMIDSFQVINRTFVHIP
jgi:hypothetical protein